MSGSSPPGFPGSRRRRETFALAWPAALTLLLHNVYRFNDLFFCKLLGREAQAAVGVAAMVTILTYAVYEGLAAGLMTLAARAHGAGQGRRARRLLGLAVGLSLVLSTGVAACGLVTMDRLTAWLLPAREGGERAALAAYLGPIFWGSFFLCLAPVVDRSFLALKDTRTPLVLECFAVALNTLLNWLLVLGPGPFPALGVAGAGIATVGSRATTALVGLWLLDRRLPRAGPVETRRLGELLARIARVGSPVCAAIAIYALSYQGMLHTTFKRFGEDGSLARATLGAGFALEGLSFCLIWGLASAVGSLVGRALGAGEVGEARGILHLGVKSVLWLSVPISLVFLVAPEPLAAALSADRSVHAEVCVYLRILALSQFAVGLQLVYENAVVTSGYAWPVFVSTSFWNLSRVPLSWFCAHALGWGLAGVWWTINLTSYGKALTAALIARYGRWQRGGL